MIRRRSPSHVRFGLFVNHGYAGELTLRTEEFYDFVLMLEAVISEDAAQEVQDEYFEQLVEDGMEAETKRIQEGRR